MTDLAFFGSSGLTILRAILPPGVTGLAFSSFAGGVSAGFAGAGFSSLGSGFISSLVSGANKSAALVSAAAGDVGKGGLVWPVRGRVSFFGAGAAVGVGLISILRFFSLARA